MLPPLPLLSLDPASTKIGWALLNVLPDDVGGSRPTYLASGVSLVPEVLQEDRVPHVGDLTNQIISQCRPRSVLIEIPDFNAQFAKKHIVWFYRAVGVVEYVAHLHGWPIFRVNASVEKRRDRKLAGIELFRTHAGRPPIRDDESDAFYNGWHFLMPLLPPPVPFCGLEDYDDDYAYPNDDDGPQNES